MPAIALSSDAVPPEARRLSFGGSGGQALHTLFRLITKRRWTVAALVGLSLIVGLLVLLLATPLFRAVATLEISREQAPVIETGDRRAPVAIDTEFYETQYGLLRSEALARRVVAQLRLADDPTYVEASTADGGNVRTARLVRERAAIVHLRETVAIVPARLSRLVEIRTSDPDPQRAARISNALSEAYMRQNLEKRVDRSAYARQFLDERIGQVRATLERSERNLVGYAGREQIILVPSSGPEGQRAASGTASTSLVGSDLAGTSQALIAARAARAEAQARYAASRASRGNRSEILLNPTVSALATQRAQAIAEAAQIEASYKGDYAPLLAKREAIRQLDRQIARIEARISGSIQSDFVAAQKREADLARQVDTLKRSLIDLSNRSIEYTILQREVDTNRALYDGLLQQYKAVSVAADLGSNNVNFVLRAEPPRKPYSPDAARVLALSLLIGGLLAIGALLLLEVLDARIATPEDFRERLDAPLLGVIPRSSAADPSADLADPRSPMSEAYSSTQANIRFSTPEGAPQILAVTSTRAGEGKSTSVIALASIIARRGGTVVVVDGDLRRPSLHRRFGLPNQAGFSDLLTGGALDEFKPSRIEALDFDLVTSGPTPPSPGDLLASPRLGEVLARLRELYDFVIIDAPPVLGLVDAPLIASAADATLFVVEAGVPRLGPIKQSVDRILDARGRMLGFLFTKYAPRRSPFSEYASYDYYSYGQSRKGD